MLLIERTTRFKRDLKLMLKRKKPMAELKEVISKLVNKLPLPASCLDHPLSGNYKGSRECHIEPDWLLIYTIDDNILRLERTGTHSDLF